MKKGALIFILGILLLAAAVSADRPFSYYIAGAYSDSDGTAYLDVFNPNEEAADTQIVVYFDKNDSTTFDVKLASERNVRIDFAGYSAGSFGLEVKSDRPLAVNGVQFDDTYSGGFGGSAAEKADFAWYFGEGYSSGMAKTYLYLLNPGQREAQTNVVLYYDNGQKKTFNVHVPASRVVVVDLKEKTQPEKRFGIKVTSPVPVVVGTGNYNKHFSAGSGGQGATKLSKVWYFPDGYASVDATDFVNVVNPSLGTAHITVMIYYEDGEIRSFDETVDSNSKKLLLLNNHVKQLKRYSVVVESDVGVVAEKTHYDSTYSAGYGSVGAVGTATKMYFSTSMVNDKTKSYLAVFNPSAKEAALNMTFYYNDGSVKDLIVTAPSLMRTTIELNKKAILGNPFGMRVVSSEPVVVNQVVYDSTRSAGYDTYGLVAPEEELIVASEPKIDDEEAEVNDEYMLVGQEAVSPSKFGNGVGEGLVRVSKNTYDKEGKSVAVWKFTYFDRKASTEALKSVLSGGLFKILEVVPQDVNGAEVHHFVSSKSLGYSWVIGEKMFVVVAADKEDAYGAVEMLMANTPAEKEEGVGLYTILLILLGLILFVVLIRWLFRPGPADDADDESVWEDMIPSAKPEEKNAKKSVKKKPVKKKSEKPAEPDKKSEDDDDKKEPDTKSRKRGRPKKEVAPERKISIKEIPHDKLTAQDILDNLEEIPDYEDVFRHVNRDHEEIKQR